MILIRFDREQAAEVLDEAVRTQQGLWIEKSIIEWPLSFVWYLGSSAKPTLGRTQPLFFSTFETQFSTG